MQYVIKMSRLHNYVSTAEVQSFPLVQGDMQHRVLMHQTLYRSLDHGAERGPADK